MNSQEMNKRIEQLTALYELLLNAAGGVNERQVTLNYEQHLELLCLAYQARCETKRDLKSNIESAELLRNLIAGESAGVQQ